MTTKEIGERGEKAAERFLTQNGYRVLEKNRHESHNEIDIIAVNKEYLVFAEVKTRTLQKDWHSAYGSPASAVTKAKQTRLINAARSYIPKQKKYVGLQPRFDVIEVYIDKDTNEISDIHHIINAFGRT